MLRWLLASFHLVAFGMGLAAIWVRRRALEGFPDPGCLRRAVRADAWWGLAALLWLGTGLPRLLIGTEKPTAYYLSNFLFWLKMGVFVLIVLLEVPVAIAFTRWRNLLRQGQTPDLTLAPRWATISRLETGLVLALLFMATALARGYGTR